LLGGRRLDDAEHGVAGLLAGLDVPGGFDDVVELVRAVDSSWQRHPG
jgi:hypothetical protein